MKIFITILSLLSALSLPAVSVGIHASLPQNLSFEAIYQFGDSISDTGNSLFDGIHPICGADYPYGETFFHHPTGRCSNGLLIIDYIARYFQLPFLSPYLDKDGNFTRGVNFAVVGATALNTSTLVEKNIPTVTNSSLLVQLDWFRSHLHTMCITPSECRQKLGKALFFVGEIGGNDYNYAIFDGKSMEVLHGLVPEIVRTIMNVVKELINFGAKQIIVPGNFPIGCITKYLALFKTNDLTKYDELKCLRSWNDFAALHNDQLQHAIKQLQKEYYDVNLVYMDYFSTFKSIIRDAPSLGFDKDQMFKACCGIEDKEYNWNQDQHCGSIGVPICIDPYRRVSWDGIHFTEHIYQLMADRLLKHMIPTITRATQRTSTDDKLQAYE